MKQRTAFVCVILIAGLLARCNLLLWRQHTNSSDRGTSVLKVFGLRETETPERVISDENCCPSNGVQRFLLHWFFIRRHVEANMAHGCASVFAIYTEKCTHCNGRKTFASLQHTKSFKDIVSEFHGDDYTSNSIEVSTSADGKEWTHVIDLEMNIGEIAVAFGIKFIRLLCKQLEDADIRTAINDPEQAVGDINRDAFKVLMQASNMVPPSKKSRRYVVSFYFTYLQI